MAPRAMKYPPLDKWFLRKKLYSPLFTEFQSIAYYELRLLYFLLYDNCGEISGCEKA